MHHLQLVSLFLLSCVQEYDQATLDKPALRLRTFNDGQEMSASAEEQHFFEHEAPQQHDHEQLGSDLHHDYEATDDSPEQNDDADPLAAIPAEVQQLVQGLSLEETLTYLYSVMSNVNDPATAVKVRTSRTLDL